MRHSAIRYGTVRYGRRVTSRSLSRAAIVLCNIKFSVFVLFGFRRMPPPPGHGVVLFVTLAPTKIFSSPFLNEILLSQSLKWPLLGNKNACTILYNINTSTNMVALARERPKAPI